MQRKTIVRIYLTFLIMVLLLMTSDPGADRQVAEALRVEAYLSLVSAKSSGCLECSGIDEILGKDRSLAKVAVPPVSLLPTFLPEHVVIATSLYLCTWSDGGRGRDLVHAVQP